MSRTTSFRIGRVQGYRRGRVWYLCYFENGRRRRPRIGQDLVDARRIAAQTNSQLESGELTLLSYVPIDVHELRQHWLDNHEHVLRSSVQTIARYRTATDHLLNYLKDHPVRQASAFTSRHAEGFTQYLREIEVAPNGHPNSAKRRLLDKGVKFILECCRALFSYAAQHRHLSPYAKNPFDALSVDRIPLENRKPIILLTPAEEAQFVEQCSDWQFTIFLTLMLTGLRPGELCHLLVEDVDLDRATLRIVNKAVLGWKIKTRAERVIPLVPVLVEGLRYHLKGRSNGSLFRRPWVEEGKASPPLANMSQKQLEIECERRAQATAAQNGKGFDRRQRLGVTRTVWRDMGAICEDRVRLEFIRVAKLIGRSDATAPKLLRHGFATALQDHNCDPLIRNQLMGHASAEQPSAGFGLAMTGQYTHSRPETVRRQLLAAMAERPLYTNAVSRLAKSEQRTAQTLPPHCNYPQ